MIYVGSGARIALMAGLYILGYISNTALAFCSHLLPIFRYPRSEAVIVCSMRVVPPTQNSFGVTHVPSPLRKG
jgi:hypothetical protein